MKQPTATISGIGLSLAAAARHIRALDAAGAPARAYITEGQTDADKLLDYLYYVLAKRVGGPRGVIVGQRVNSWSRDGRNEDIEVSIGRRAPRNSGATWTGVTSTWVYLRESEIDEAVAALRAYRGNQVYGLRANLYDGVLEVNPLPDDEAGWAGLTTPSGGVFTRVEVGPWGQDEFGMERADLALAAQGFVRVSRWTKDEFRRTEIRQVGK